MVCCGAERYAGDLTVPRQKAVLQDWKRREGPGVGENLNDRASNPSRRRMLIPTLGGLLAALPPVFVVWAAVARYGRLPIWSAAAAGLSTLGFAWVIRRRLRKESRRQWRLATLAGIILSLPPALLFVWLGQNRWSFAPYWLYVFLGLGVAAALLDRLRGRPPHHEATWVVFFLALHASLHCASGYAYLGGWALAVFLYFPAAIYYLFPSRTRCWRILAGVIAALTAGFAMNLMFRQSLLIDEAYYCERQRRSLPEFVQVINGPTQCFDLAGASGRAKAAAGFSSVAAPYLLDLETMILHEGERLSHGIRSVTPHPSRDEFALVTWENYGRRRHVVMADAAGAIIGEAQAPDCRKPAKVAFHRDRMLLLCEESHSLHVFPATPPYEEQTSLVLPGRRSHDLALDAAQDRAYVTDYGAAQLVEVDLAAWRIRRTMNVGWSTFGIIRDARGLLYLAQPMKRRVLLVEPDSLTVADSFSTGYGPRALAFDDRRGVLLVGNYFSGTVEAFSADGRRLTNFYAGRLLRGLWLDARRDRLFLATGCGVRWVNLKKVLAEEPAGRRRLSLSAGAR